MHAGQDTPGWGTQEAYPCWDGELSGSWREGSPRAALAGKVLPPHIQERVLSRTLFSFPQVWREAGI